jgi:hypothetical protein
MLLAETVTNNNNIDLKKKTVGDQEYALIQKVRDQYFCYIVNPYGFNVKLSLTLLCAIPGSVSNGHVILKRFMLVSPKLQGWIYLKANEARALRPLILMDPLQGPGRGPSVVFTLSYVFEKFAKVRYFTYNQLSIIEVCQEDINRNITSMLFFWIL